MSALILAIHFFKTGLTILDRIPFERALDFANKEKITELLYPLFVHNIGALLYHPTNSNRTGAVMQAMDRRNYDTKQHKQGIANASGAQPPPLQHHHSVNNPVSSQVSQSSHSIAPHPGSVRPGIDRAHTFPTPPTSASSGIGMGSSGSSYDWSAQSMANGVQAIEPHSHSTPHTPATTPPGTALPTMHSYPGQTSYDNSRSMYPSNGQQQSSYPTQQSSSYIKHEMGPPSARAPGSVSEHLDQKPDVYAQAQNTEHGHHGPEEEADHEHDTEYPTENQAAYNAARTTYNYNSNPNMGSLHGEQTHMPSDINGSPHQNGSNRGTPRNSTGSQPQWHNGYDTPPRASGFYNVTSDTRSAPVNGTASNDAYGGATLPAGYAPTQMNGTSKRMREEDDHDSRSDGRGEDLDNSKRRKTLEGGSSYEGDVRLINRAKGSSAHRTRR